MDFLARIVYLLCSVLLAGAIFGLPVLLASIQLGGSLPVFVPQERAPERVATMAFVPPPPPAHRSPEATEEVEDAQGEQGEQGQDEAGGPGGSGEGTGSARRSVSPDGRVVYGNAETLRRQQQARGEQRERPTRRTPPSRCQEGHPSIEQLADTRYAVERALVDYYAGNLGNMRTLAGASFHREDGGRVEGVRVGRIPCGTVLHAGGLRTGDVVHSVNGRPLRNLPQAYGVWREVRREDRVRVAITREGRPMTLEYRIRA